MYAKMESGIRQFDALYTTWVDEPKKDIAKEFILFLRTEELEQVFIELFDVYNENFGIWTFLRFAEPENYVLKAIPIEGNETLIKYLNEKWIEKLI